MAAKVGLQDYKKMDGNNLFWPFIGHRLRPDNTYTTGLSIMGPTMISLRS